MVNSGVRITGEYAVARGRTDLLVEWPLPRQRLASGASKPVIEWKMLGERSGSEATGRHELWQTPGAWICGVRSRDTW